MATKLSKHVYGAVDWLFFMFIVECYWSNAGITPFYYSPPLALINVLPFNILYKYNVNLIVSFNIYAVIIAILWFAFIWILCNSLTCDTKIIFAFL